MSTKRKGIETTCGEWRKHLRRLYKRAFWKAERKAANQKAAQLAKEQRS